MTQVPTAVSVSAMEAAIADLFAVADALRREGRATLALPILQMLSRLHPGRDAVRLAYVRTLSELGRTFEAIDELNALKQRSASGGVLAAIQGEARVAIERFNAHLARNEPVEAERYAAALAALLPQHVPSLQAALSCNVALGRKEEAIRYGRAILALEPQNLEIQHLLVSLLTPAAGQPEAATEAKPAPRRAKKAKA